MKLIRYVALAALFISAQTVWADFLTVNNGTGSGSYPHGAVASVSARSCPTGQVFDRWYATRNSWGDAENMEFGDWSQPSTTFKMEFFGDRTITAACIDPSTRWVSVRQGYAFDQKGNNPNYFSVGTTVRLQFFPSAGIPGSFPVFDYWQGLPSGDINNSSATFVMPSSNVQINPVYHYAYTVSVASGSGSGVYEAGAKVNISAIAVPDGLVFDHWFCQEYFSNIGSIVQSPTSKDTVLTVPSVPIHLEAIFKSVPLYGLSVENGSGTGKYAGGWYVTIVASAPPTGQKFDKWETYGNPNIDDIHATTTRIWIPLYDIKVTATYGTIPVITKNPDPVTAWAGTRITLNVTATGAAPLAYHWQKNGTDIPGETNSSLWIHAFDGAQPADSGLYRCRVSNSFGQAYSTESTVTVKLNLAPVATIVAPQTTDHFSAGSQIFYQGYGQDPEDGTIEKGTWLIYIGVGTSSRADILISSYTAGGYLRFPTTLNYGVLGQDAVINQADLFLGARFNVQDSAGAFSVQKEVIVFPDLVQFKLQTSPAGLKTGLDNFGPTTWGFDIVTLNSIKNLPRTLTSPSNQVLDGKTYAMDHWSNGSTSTYTVLTPLDGVTYTAYFKKVSLGLSVINGSGTGDYLTGTSVVVVASAPVSGMMFDHWEGAVVASSSSVSTTLVMPSSTATLKAIYKPIPAGTFAVSVNGGSGAGSYMPGATVSITWISTSSLVAFDHWDGNATFADASKVSTTFTMPSHDVSIKAITRLIGEAKALHQVTVAHGTGSGQYSAGTTVAITADPDGGNLKFVQWLGDVTFADHTARSTTFVMPDHDIIVTAILTTIISPQQEVAPDNSIGTFVNRISPKVGTDIPVGLPTRQHVELSVYDMSGRLVRRIADDDMGGGTTPIHWDGKNDDGAELSSDVYLLVLKTGGHIEKKKIIVRK